MFGKKKQPPIRTLIGEGTRIEGCLAFIDALRIDGEVVGDVIGAEDAPTLLVISEKAKVIGKVKARHVIINGTVEGPVESDELLELQPKARIHGDVRYQSLEMHQGATIEGQVQVLKADEPAAAGPLKLASSNG
ncbi:bactofilin family protein [Caldimonas thermodepolymerans]|jgi:cytoskeletal protein CcmA (bactofilin family)|uniref:Cytoskeletal protein CcmA (Bactofilin family) n=1 Tax=Caldimonas thermodepolymerans TaxID=215580 RepID=A0AA46DBD2_9BURK|nr:polymer-forming cytoskeletal protein [Caldimonas thermodepolymerans]TCP04800.1 cytoskeletal protein CcmA (bactofilin family) [Caldimonas thermodepolymerans]UZG43874.1 polymer-forming cytoskeletal protein [Caldimonas thermodepolymerans]UZG47542.1 polymer-forming cytoskeletal protein [Caldimonas thermodepolymerans]